MQALLFSVWNEEKDNLIDKLDIFVSRAKQISLCTQYTEGTKGSLWTWHCPHMKEKFFLFQNHK